MREKSRKCFIKKKKTQKANSAQYVDLCDEWNENRTIFNLKVTINSTMVEKFVAKKMNN